MATSASCAYALLLNHLADELILIDGTPDKARGEAPTRMTGQYGLHDVSLSTPCVVGNCGIESVLELRLDPAEQKALEYSASVLQHAAAHIKTV